MAFIPYGQPGLAGALAMMQPMGGNPPPQQQFMGQQQQPQPMQAPVQYTDPAVIQRRQQLAEALRANAARGGNPRSGMEAIGNLAQTLSAAWIDRRANKATERNAEARKADLQGALAEPDPIMRAKKLAASPDENLQRIGVSSQLDYETQRAAQKADIEKYREQQRIRSEERSEDRAFREKLAADQRNFAAQTREDAQRFAAEQNAAKLSAAAAKTGGRQKLTEGQAKFATFANIAEKAEQRLSRLEGTEGFNASLVMNDKANVLRNDKGQEYMAAKRTFIDAIIRPMTGAAVTKEEFKAADQRYFPKFGDSPETIRTKSELRRNAIESIKAGSHGGYDSIFGAESQAPQPKTGKVSFDDFMQGGF